jgi:bla regulator protein blaR1
MNKKIILLFLVLVPLGIFGCSEKRTVDNIDLPFINDPAVIGKWTTVDFVAKPSLFTLGTKSFKGDLYLKELIFLPEGKAPESWITWTKGVVIHSGEKTASAYEIKEVNKDKYMFFEWKSGDYTIRHQKPKYYVLKKD